MMKAMVVLAKSLLEVIKSEKSDLWRFFGFASFAVQKVKLEILLLALSNKRNV